eukprot:8342226-Alexandrium_andersonii.AAC.1
MAEGSFAAAVPQATTVPPHPDAGRVVTVEVCRTTDCQRILVTVPMLGRLREVLNTACEQLDEEPQP